MNKENRINYERFPSLSLIENASIESFQKIKLLASDKPTLDIHHKEIFSTLADIMAVSSDVLCVETDLILEVQKDMELLDKYINFEINSQDGAIFANNKTVIFGNFVVHTQQIHAEQISEVKTALFKNNVLVGIYKYKLLTQSKNHVAPFLWESEDIKNKLIEMGKEKYNATVYFSKIALPLLIFCEQTELAVEEVKGKGESITFGKIPTTYFNETDLEIGFVDTFKA